MDGQSWICYKGRSYGVSPGERAIDAMLRQGAPVQFSCRKGACRSCMLQAVSGDPGPQASERLPEELRKLGMFLPCCATEVRAVVARQPDPNLFTHKAVVVAVSRPAHDIIRLSLEPETDLPWQPGQAIGLYNRQGDVRSYSVTSLKSDYFLDIDIRVYEKGAVSSWASGLEAGEVVRLQAPAGAFVYSPNYASSPLVLIATGTGAGAILGITRDALASGHEGPIYVYNGGRSGADLYLEREFAELQSSGVTVVQAASQEEWGSQPAAQIVDLAFERHTDLENSVLFLCGNPDMVEAARIRALTHGASLDRIVTDPFEPPVQYVPKDGAKLKAIEPDPALWAALANGAKLTEILTDFYTEVYQDARLAPFFHRTSRRRAIEKQYNFLQDLFSGSKLYFGEKPFNAHHWMVISNELFDYREKLFFEIVRRHGIAEEFVRRWSAIHEMFRREIVKSAARGILIGGVEHDREGYHRERLDISTICDGCGGEVATGTEVLTHIRTGELFCVDCESEAPAGPGSV